MKEKRVSLNAAINTKEDAEEDGMVNVAVGCSNERRPQMQFGSI